MRALLIDLDGKLMIEDIEEMYRGRMFYKRESPKFSLRTDPFQKVDIDRIKRYEHRISANGYELFQEVL